MVKFITEIAHYVSQSLHIPQFFLNLSNDRAYHSSVKFSREDYCSIQGSEKHNKSPGRDYKVHYVGHKLVKNDECQR